MGLRTRAIPMTRSASGTERGPLASSCPFATAPCRHRAPFASHASIEVTSVAAPTELVPEHRETRGPTRLEEIEQHRAEHAGGQKLQIEAKNHKIDARNRNKLMQIDNQGDQIEGEKAKSTTNPAAPSSLLTLLNITADLFIDMGK